ncbi:MAG: D-2-hydroxyacid dehydrogenase [Acidimicrobiales bacterium]
MPPATAGAELSVVSLVPVGRRWGAAIEAVDPAVRLTVAAGWFDDDIRAGWGDWTADSYLRPRPGGPVALPPREEREAALAGADVILAGFPVPVDLRARSPRLRWVHQTPAGASNLRRCDLWGSDVTVTTSRGLGNTLAIAEWVVAAFLHFARQLHRAPAEAAAGRFDRFAYQPVLFAGKTVCVVGAGGIGQDVGRLCAALGAARVVGTRRTPPPAGEPLPEGFAEIAGPERLPELLADSAFVAVCAQWTPETHGLIGAETLAAMPDGAVLANVARGELIDEDALAAHVDRLGGVALDVYVGEFEHAPPAWLWEHPRVLVTPHVSGGSDAASQRPLDLFVDNLTAFVAGQPLRNIVDWSRGY